MSGAEAAAAPRTPKAPDRTRAALLEAAFKEIHRVGFQAASLSRILSATGLTKGALYHHFPDKRALGLAVVDQVILPDLRRRWVEPLAAAERDPIDVLIGIIEQEGAGHSNADLALGRPLNNLAQEMSPIDEGFRERIAGAFTEWREAIRLALAAGQRRAKVDGAIDVAAAAAFIVAAVEGCVGQAKVGRNRDLLHASGSGLLAYLELLRSQQATTKSRE